MSSEHVQLRQMQWLVKVYLCIEKSKICFSSEIRFRENIVSRQTGNVSASTSFENL